MTGRYRQGKLRRPHVEKIACPSVVVMGEVIGLPRVAPPDEGIPDGGTRAISHAAR